MSLESKLFSTISVGTAPPNSPGMVDSSHATSLVGYDTSALDAVLTELSALVPAKMHRMRRQQIWKWLYAYGVTDFAEMHNIGKPLRDALAGRFTLQGIDVTTMQTSRDGTIKWLFRLADGYEVETVFIPGNGRGTLCISSQVGCTLNCRFCYTGTQRLVRNLAPHEIVGQLVAARHALDDWPHRGTHNNNVPPTRAITNIVMMGMGEPLYNTDNVIRALNVMSDGDGLSFSKRRITLSTAGVAPLIARIGHETGVMLAISLHAVTDEIRNELVPINKKYPLAELLDACRHYPGISNTRRITFEYVMLKGINDSDADARAFVKLLRGIPAKINLIPFNPWPGAPYACATPARITQFATIINRAGYASPVRHPRGRDIMAACGQLKSASLKQQARRNQLALQ